jgi:hypothetical protein
MFILRGMCPMFQFGLQIIIPIVIDLKVLLLSETAELSLSSYWQIASLSSALVFSVNQNICFNWQMPNVNDLRHTHDINTSLLIYQSELWSTIVYTSISCPITPCISNDFMLSHCWCCKLRIRWIPHLSSCHTMWRICCKVNRATFVISNNKNSNIVLIWLNRL